MANEVFICYASSDKSVADRICVFLESQGVRCWIAPRDVLPGSAYLPEVLEALVRSRVVVLVLSANANASPHVLKEVERAVRNGVPVIPIRIEAVVPTKRLNYFIGAAQCLDSMDGPVETHLQHLPQIVRKLPLRNS